MKQTKFTGVNKFRGDILADNDEQGRGGWCWWRPRQDSLFVAFCKETSIHGLKFLGQEKRHISERIFWLISILVSVLLALYYIYQIYQQFERMPVMVTFQPRELNLDSVPFPAVTLCNMNKFPKKKVEQLEKKACNAQQSFAKDFGFAYNRGKNKMEHSAQELSEDDLLNMTDFILDNTLPCDQLIRLCKFGKTKVDCSKLFKPIITDFGKCCTFNLLPLPLLLRNPNNENRENATIYDNPILGNGVRLNWPQSELNEWGKWNYDDGVVLKKDTTYPWRQERSGLPYGLSFLIDPNTEDYYCPSSDAMGASYILHSPLEMPAVTAFSSVAHLHKEILIEVHPDVTNADDDIKEIDPDKRLCFFGGESKLKLFGPYTSSNCMDECAADMIAETCSCAVFYMPRDDGMPICNSHRASSDSDCIDLIKDRKKYECQHCLTLCKNIAYNYETTTADLQPYEQLWGDPNPWKYPKGPPNWTNHTMSLVHVFFGAEATVPKLRKRISKKTDIVANTGGILGLCLGFSILSCAEVFYFCTLRTFWKFCRARHRNKQQAQGAESKQTGGLFEKQQSNKVIQLNPNMIPVYPYDINMKRHGQISTFYGCGW